MSMAVADSQDSFSSGNFFFNGLGSDPGFDHGLKRTIRIKSEEILEYSFLINSLDER